MEFVSQIKRALEPQSTEGVTDSSKNSMEFEQTELNTIEERDCYIWKQSLKCVVN